MRCGCIGLLVLLNGAMASVAAEIDRETLSFLKTFRGEFVAIVPGQGKFPAEFMMGRGAGLPAEQPAHRVVVPKPFAIARYEVPQDLWQAVMGENPSRWKGPRNAVEMLTFDEAVSFCEKATELLRKAKLIEPAQVVRLPSEAEWEYAARAGTTTLYSFGDDVGALDEHAWSTRNAAGNDPPVGAKKPNPWGLHDMHGYLWEWCADAWHDNYTGAPADDTAWTMGGDATRAVLRSGSWKDPAELLTSTQRRGAPRTLKDDAVGLRCVLQ